MKKTLFLLSLTIVLYSCVTTGKGSGVNLQEAIEQSAEKIANDLPDGSIVAVVAFDSENDNLSEYIIGELNGALFDRKIIIVTRRSLDYIQKELNFQMSGDVSDETAKSIGKFFGASLIIVGELLDVGKNYRFSIDALHVEEAKHGSTVRLDVQKGREIQNMISTLANQKSTGRTERYEITEQTRPNNPLAYLERGILFAMRRDFEIAIMDFNDAIKLNQNLVGAYMLRGRALYASVSDELDITGENFSGVYAFISKYGEMPEDKIETLDRAATDFSHAIRLEPNNAAIYRERSTIYLLKRDYEKAISDITQAIRFEPNNINYYLNRALLYENYSRDYDRAIADYSQMLRLDPLDFVPLVMRAQLYYLVKKDYERAIADYEEILRIHPNEHPYILSAITDVYDRGAHDFYRNKKDYIKAIEIWDKLIKIAPDKNDPYFRINVIEDLEDRARNRRQNLYKESIDDWTQLIRLNPVNKIFYYCCRGETYRLSGDRNRVIGDFDLAILDLEMVLKSDPNAYAVFEDKFVWEIIEDIKEKRKIYGL